MKRDRRRQAEAIFQRALDLPAPARERFARDVCDSDVDLLAEVLRLLSSDPGTDVDAFGTAPMRLGPAGRLLTDPERIGPYRVLQRVGEGGFGVVYEVEQSEPIRRRLALKVVKAGMDTDEVLARFEAERQALALMDHPNVARVVDAGATEQGRPYFAMEMVRGDPITLYCDRERLNLSDRIALFLGVCRAVQHAHQKGILHRDLKPSNILVTRVDGEATPKIIDFGIAKALSTPLVDRTLRTAAGQLMGTPAYMSPEQAERTGIDVDTSSDVYSLGVVLYELLCGKLPIPGEAFSEFPTDRIGELVRRSRRSAPSARFAESDEDAIQRAWWRSSDPWQLRGRLKGDLDWIVMMAIASDRGRRYQTVQELIAELQRHRANEPVHAGPPGVRYRTSKFVRRHRVALGLVGVVMIGLVGAGSGLTWALIQTNQQKQKIEAARGESEAVLDFLVRMLASARPMEFGGNPTIREVLDRAAAELGDELGDRPLVEARLRTVVGGAYRELGRFEEAAVHLDRARMLRARESGPDSPELAPIDREIGLLQMARGDYDEARSTLTGVVTTLRNHSEQVGPDLVRSLSDLAGVHILAEADVEAIPLLEEALVLGDPILPPEDPVRSELHSNLGVAYQAVGRFEDAEKHLKRYVALEAQRHGPEHVNTRLAGANLAAFYRETGDLDQAETYYVQALEAARELYGDEHPITLRFRGNLGLMLIDLERYDEALVHCSEVLEIRRRVLGPDNPSTLVSQLNLSLLYLNSGDHQRALPLATRTEDQAARVFGHEHLYSLIAGSHIARAHLMAGDAATAATHLQDVIERARRVLPEGHWRVGVFLHLLGNCCRQQGRYDESEAALVEAHTLLADSFGPGDDRTREVIGDLVSLFDARGDTERAEQWRRRLPR